jgi:hypothetical protein
MLFRGGGIVMQGSDFTKVRVGDKIFTQESGEVEVSKVEEDDFYAGGYWYRKDNGFQSYLYIHMPSIPSAFWSKPNIEIPPPPKRMVKKTIRVWATIHNLSTNGILGIISDEYTAKQWGLKCRVEELSKEIEVEE